MTGDGCEWLRLQRFALTFVTPRRLDRRPEEPSEYLDSACRFGWRSSSPLSLGVIDMYGARLRGTQKLACELTLREGKIVYDLNGITRPDWDKLPRDYKQPGDARWDSRRR